MNDQDIWMLQPIELGRNLVPMYYLRTYAQVDSIWNKSIRKEQLVLVCVRALQLADVENKAKQNQQVTNILLEYDQFCVQYLCQVK